MKASVGDRIVIASSTLPHPARDGRILEVRGTDGDPPFLVEWSDNGHQALIFPGPDAHVQHFGPDGRPAAPAPVVHKHTWHVDLAIVEQDGQTVAHAALVGKGSGAEADGRARLNPSDTDVPEIGDELAVARALRSLSDRLIRAATADIELIEGAPVTLAPR